MQSRLSMDTGPDLWWGGALDERTIPAQPTVVLRQRGCVRGVLTAPRREGVPEPAAGGRRRPVGQVIDSHHRSAVTPWGAEAASDLDGDVVLHPTFAASATAGREPGPRRGGGVDPRSGEALKRVLVVADFNLTADALRVTLTNGGFHVLSAPVPASRAEVRALDLRLRSFRPRAAILMQEIATPVDVNNATRTLTGLSRLPWLLLTTTPEGPRWGAGLAAGASAVLPMSIRVADLVATLTQLCQGQEVMTPSEKSRLVDLWSDIGAQQQQLADGLASLTRREMQVLEELSQGRAVAQIAASRGVTVGTVRTQVKSILRKLGVSSQLAAVAALQRAVDPPSQDAS